MSNETYPASRALVKAARTFAERGTGFMYSNDELQALLAELSRHVAVGVHDVVDTGWAVSMRITVYLTIDPSDLDLAEEES